MRHIPDEELHAYLDQALSRSQCVEIETHLAACVRCRHERDQIAALRDRTTALLGRVSPPRQRRPVFAELLLEARGRQAMAHGEAVPVGAARARWLRAGRRAAGVLLAITVGWSARGLVPGAGEAAMPAGRTFAFGDPLAALDAGRQPAFSSIVPTRTARPPEATPATSAPAPDWQPDPVEREAPRPAPRTGPAPLAVTVRATPGPDAALDFAGSGVWRTVSWEEAAALTGDQVHRIQDLRVMEILLKSLGGDQRPMVIVVHEDGRGNLVRTIEGPVEEVASLVSDEIAGSGGALRTSNPQRTRHDYIAEAGDATWRQLRVVTVAGRLESAQLEDYARAIRRR